MIRANFDFSILLETFHFFFSRWIYSVFAFLMEAAWNSQYLLSVFSWCSFQSPSPYFPFLNLYAFYVCFYIQISQCILLDWQQLLHGKDHLYAQSRNSLGFFKFQESGFWIFPRIRVTCRGGEKLHLKQSLQKDNSCRFHRKMRFQVWKQKWKKGRCCLCLSVRDKDRCIQSCISRKYDVFFCFLKC